MQQYANLSGCSGVSAFELLDDGIRVQFRSGDVYTYTIRSAGSSNIVQMIELAKDGRGLSTYISQNCRELFESKE